MSETHVNVGTIISFFFLFLLMAFKIEIDIKLADDPEFTKVEYFTPSHLYHVCSNSYTFFDWVKIVSLFFKNFLTALIS